MRLSKTLIPTLKEDPNEASVASHRLMLRSGMIRQLTAGVYSWLPLGLRALRKVEAIVREEMDAAGAQEVLMPSIQPAELWEESKRWGQYGKELLRITDRHGRDFCYGPTHEEVISDLVRKNVRSYKELPANFYQIQTKFRDEIRPRFGIMRGREFLMKDAYSFHMDDADLDVGYKGMFTAYEKIFSRCGLAFKAVEADTGSIGGTGSHEFHVLADTGEDLIASCDICRYAANVERAEVKEVAAAVAVGTEEKKRVDTPDQRTMEEVSAFLDIPLTRNVKSLVVETDQGLHLALLRGDHELMETKLKSALGAEWLELPDPQKVREAMGAPVGSLGPVDSPIPVIADQALKEVSNFVCGANEEGVHLTGVNWERDLEAPRFADFRGVIEGDACPRCDTGKLAFFRGIEVGHVFKLGTKYSEALNVSVLNQQGKDHILTMGCYGIGVSRTVAAAIEQNHDESGIVWPMALAPFQVELVLMDLKEEAMTLAEEFYARLTAAGADVLMDDRKERPGIKFKDADLIGAPLRMVIGGRSLKEGLVEVKERKSGDMTKLSPEEAIAHVTSRMQQMLEVGGGSTP